VCVCIRQVGPIDEFVYKSNSKIDEYERIIWIRTAIVLNGFSITEYCCNGKIRKMTNW
jgi:hypothetical protein